MGELAPLTRERIRTLKPGDTLVLVTRRAGLEVTSRHTVVDTDPDAGTVQIRDFERDAARGWSLSDIHDPCGMSDLEDG